MKSWILGVVLAGVTATGVTMLAVGANGRHGGSCAPAPTEPTAASAEVEPSCCDLCPSCKPNPSGVYDVADLPSGFQSVSVERPFVSFDEPPLAKGVSCETLPPPREVR
jgi:hypothetical protein